MFIRGGKAEGALLAMLESEAAKLGVKLIWADVSITAKEFFVSRGFRVTEAKANVTLSHPAPNFRMEKALNSEPDGSANRGQPVGPRPNRTPQTAGSGG
jgi:hypothetical protein